MDDGGIIALMSVIIRNRGTKGGLSCSGHESTRPVAVCRMAGGGVGGREKWTRVAASNDLGQDVKIPNTNKEADSYLLVLYLPRVHNKRLYLVARTH